MSIGISSTGIVTLPPPLPEKFDFFHAPYPASALDLLPPKASTDAAVNASDPIDRLPQEVCDQIFCQLSTANLDAARYVSRAWYQRIMTNSWVLRRVLEPGSYSRLDPVYWECKEDSRHTQALRHLAKELDARSRLTSCGSCDEAWKVRYRRCDMTYTMAKRRGIAAEAGQGTPDPQGESRQITFAGISKSGTFAAFICVQSKSGNGDMHSIHVYHFDYSGKPELITSIPCLEGKGTPVSVELSEGESAGSWLAEVTFSRYKTTHLFNSPCLGQPKSGQEITTSREPVSKSIPDRPVARQWPAHRTTCCTYHDRIVSDATDTKDIVDFLEEVDWVCIEHHEIWFLLENLPIGKDNRPYFIARHEETGNLFIVRQEKRAIGDVAGEIEEVVVPIVLLTRPHHHASYTNFSVAPMIWFETCFLQQFLRVAVLWHEADFPTTGKVGLYIYDIVCLRDRQCDEHGNRVGDPVSYSRGWRMGPNGNYEPRSASRSLTSGEPFDHLEHTYVTNEHRRQMKNLKGCVSGKRICSFDPGMGGLHASVRPTHDIHKTGAPPSQSLGSIRLLGDGKKRCMIWGAPGNPSSATGVTLTILEFGRSWHHDEVWELGLPLKDLGRDRYNREMKDRFLHQCACAYHDFGYRIIFPNPDETPGPYVAANSTSSTSDIANPAPVKKKRPASFQFWPVNSNLSAMTSIAARARSPTPPPSAAGQITSFHTYTDLLLARRKEQEEAEIRRRQQRIEESEAYFRSMGIDMRGNVVIQDSLAVAWPRPSRICPGGGWARRLFWWRQAGGSVPL